jgi:PucR-like helix-turn-helix protein
MTKSLDFEPWRDLPTRVADLIEPELAAITAEILASIAAEVPEYARPLEGRFGRGIRTGVDAALRQFLALIRDPDADRGPGRDVYVQLGSGELRQGRTLDSLQAAYRVGARVAWRRFATVGREAGLEAEPLSLLAEAIFAYIEQISAASVDGYAAAQKGAEDVRGRRRHELIALLLREPAAERSDVAAAARAAGWSLPQRFAVAACADRDLSALAAGLPESVSTVLEEAGCLLLPDPDGPGREAALDRIAGTATVAVGPAVEPGGAGESWSLARALLAASEAGALPGSRVLRAERHLAELLLFEGAPLVARIAARRLASFRELTPKAGERMRETALAHVRHNGNAVAMAAELHIHPQTARYRIARLRELLGDQLDDPDARFELELALRASA